MTSTASIHPLSDVQSEQIGAGTRIWQFCVVLAGAQIGSECNICAHCFIESDVVIGDRVTIKNGVQIWNGTVIEDGVFIGPNVTLTNDKYPVSGNRDFNQQGIKIRKRATIGAGSVLLPGVEIGEEAIVGAGAIVTRDVEPGSCVVNCPAHPLT
jgi:acetyltransferase-like isoleucine patch superfamily enzyme